MTNTSETIGDGVSFIVYLPFRPEVRDHARALLFKIIEEMSHEPDFVGTSVHEDMNDSNVIVNYETWSCSREHFITNHLTKAYRLAYEQSLPALLSGPRRIEFLRRLAVYDAPRKQFGGPGVTAPVA